MDLALDHVLLKDHDYALVDRLAQPGDAWPPGLRVQPLVSRELRQSEALLPGLVVLSDLDEAARSRRAGSAPA